MKFQAVKGTRDFYPDDMRLRNYIVDAWRRVSLRNGFEEYDAPIFEYLDLFTVKSGEEIAEQLFSFTDRGGRRLAIRPEITPSLARMVAAKINSLPRPIKWFSIPRLCRAENPQRGRLREFFQWNIDVIGFEADKVLADADCIFTLCDFLREVGLKPEDIQIRVGSRPVVTKLLTSLGVETANLEKALLALDRRQKLSEEAFAKACREVGLNDTKIRRVCEFMDIPPDQCLAEIKKMSGMHQEEINLRALCRMLETMGVADYIRLDWHIVRGLAYYTGIVYEAIAEGERAVAGGGRYDNLLQLVGGPAVTATGFGMGDVVLGLLLDEKGKLPADLRKARLDFFVIPESVTDDYDAWRLVADLRRLGHSTDFRYKPQPMGKQLKEANRRGAAKALLISGGKVAVKDLATGDQAEPVTTDKFLKTAGG